MKPVVFQGAPGAYSHEAAELLFSEVAGAEFRGVTGFRAVFESVIRGDAVAGVVPIENSLAGSIHDNFNHLAEFPVSITGEIHLPIAHALAANPGAVERSLTRVLSHPKALEQCASFFEDHPSVEQVVWGDTAGAALHVSTSGRSDWAAICSPRAASRYGLAVLREGIQDHPSNTTRFVELRAAPLPLSNPSRGSIVFHLRHEPGTLAGFLNRTADAGFNLTKIESLPVGDRPFEYRFFVDLECPKGGAAKLPELLENSRDLMTYSRILGVYERTEKR